MQKLREPLKCTYSVYSSEDCEWTDWLNQYCDNKERVKGTGPSGVKYEGKSDRPKDKGGDNDHPSNAFVHYCPSNGIVTGFIGKHHVTGKDLAACDGYTRDYLWKIKCCKVKNRKYPKNPELYKVQKVQLKLSSGH